VADGPPAVVALLADRSALRGLAAGFEEEGVPLAAEHAEGDRLALAQEAARRSPLGIGIGGDARGLALVLAAAPRRAYLEEPPEGARRLGTAAARLVARRPIGTHPPGRGRGEEGN
jgi:hypothetical protein